MSKPVTPAIRKRHVFYLCGFDPRGARYYHGLYREHAAKQALLTGASYNVSARKRQSAHIHRWDVDSNGVRTAYDYLSWDDIVRDEWSDHALDTYRDVWFFFRYYFLNGHIWKFGRDRLHPLMAGFYPLVLTLLTFIAAMVVFACAYAFWPSIGGALCGLVLAWLVLRGGLRFGHRFAAYWLLRIYVFSVRWARGQVQGIDARIDAFATAVIAALDDPETDEVLVVGHSVGGMISIPLTARVLAARPDTQKLSLLTVGACIPLISFWDTADIFRQDLAAVAQYPNLTWVDYTAKTDGACFYLLDPVRASGIGERRGPHLLSPRFFTLYDAKAYSALRFNWYKIHFLYLMAGDIAGVYDFFAMTAGERPLSDRTREQL